MERKTKKMGKSCNSTSVLGVVIVSLLVIQSVTLYFTINPPTVSVIQGVTKEEKQNVEANKELLKKVAKHTTIDENQEALVLTINDVEKLRAENALNERVYKDAQNKDRVIGFNDRMIIYNEENDVIVYEGKTPVQMQEEELLVELQPILAKLGDLVEINPEARPRLLTVTDADAAREKQPDIYEDADDGDKVLIYTDRLIIYRPLTNEVVFDKPLVVQQ